MSQEVKFYKCHFVSAVYFCNFAYSKRELNFFNYFHD